MFNTFFRQRLAPVAVCLLPMLFTACGTSLAPTSPPTFTLTVTVADSSTTLPVVGAKLQLNNIDQAGAPAGMAMPTATTDSSGVAVFSNLIAPTGTVSYSIQVLVAPGYQLTTTSFSQTGKQDSSQSLTLTPVSFSLAVTVQDGKTKSPLAGAQVALLQNGAPVSGVMAQSTDSSGTTTFSGLSGPGYSVSVSVNDTNYVNPTNAPVTSPSTTGSSTDGGTANLTVSLTPAPYTLDVIVKDQKTGKVVPGAQVALNLGGMPASGATQTDQTGTAVFSSLTQSGFTVSVSAASYGTVTNYPVPPPPPPGGTEKITVSIQFTYPLQVTVLDARTQSPLMGALVQLQQGNSPTAVGELQSTRDLGMTTFQNLSGSGYTVFASQDAYVSKTATVTPPTSEGGTAKLTIKLTPLTYSLVVTVQQSNQLASTLQASEAVTGAPVTGGTVTGGLGNSLPVLAGAKVSLKQGQTQVGSPLTTNASGQCTFTGLLYNVRYTVSASKTGFTPSSSPIDNTDTTTTQLQTGLVLSPVVVAPPPPHPVAPSKGLPPLHR